MRKHKLFKGDSSIYKRTATKTVSNITTRAERLEVYFESPGEGTAEAGENNANSVAKNPTRALELVAVLSNADAIGNPKATAATTSSVDNSFSNERVNTWKKYIQQIHWWNILYKYL